MIFNMIIGAILGFVLANLTILALASEKIRTGGEIGVALKQEYKNHFLFLIILPILMSLTSSISDDATVNSAMSILFFFGAIGIDGVFCKEDN